MNPPAHHSDQSDSWFQRDAAPERRPDGSWVVDDPLAGPLPAPEGRATHGETTREASARHLAGEDVPATPRQHAERVPRYTGAAAQGPVQPPASVPPAAQASPGVDPPTMAQPVVGQSAGPAGIPPSLSPMLSHEDPRYTEPMPARGYRAAQPAGTTGAVRRAGEAGGGASPNPAIRVAVVLVTLLAAVPSVLLLYQALFQTDVISAPGVIGGTLMLIGLPMFAAGVLPVMGGAVPADDTRALLRPPLVYLMAGAVLLLAAGAAAG